MTAPWPAPPPGDSSWPPPVPGAVPPIVRGGAAFPVVPPPRPSGAHPALRPSDSVPVVTPARQTGRHARRQASAPPSSTVPPALHGTGPLASSGPPPAPSTARHAAVRGLPAEGDEIDGYRILSTIGRGSMGRVYRARDPLGRDVALKVILGSQADAEGLQRFTREGQAMAAVPRHRNVVNVHTTGTARGLPYLVLDLVEGESLADVLKRGRMRVVDAVGMTIKLARAVHHVHSAGVLHRDLKPANILIRKDDREPVLSDFGMAGLRGADRLTRTGDLLGTPLYMPPEQVLGMVRMIDARSDVWALGVMLYEMLAGVPPFTGRTLVEVSRAITSNEPPPIEGIDPGLMGVIQRALAKRREDRFPSAAALADALATWGAGEAPPPPPPRRNRLTVGLAVAAAAGAALGGAALVVAARARATPGAVGPQQPGSQGLDVADGPRAPGPKEAPSPLGRFEPLVQQVRDGQTLEAQGWLNQQRWTLRKDVRDEAAAAQAALRELVPSIVARRAPTDELHAALAIVRRLRELAESSPEPDAATDEVLRIFKEDMKDRTDAPRAPQRRPDGVVDLVETVAEAGLLPTRPLDAERALDAAMLAYLASRLDMPLYCRVLVAMVRLDVDILRDHVVRLSVTHDFPRGPAADFLALRIRGEDFNLGDEGRRAIAVAMLELARAKTDALGPVTRGRALWSGAQAASDPKDSHALLEEAARLDPRSPFPHFQLANRLLHERRRADAAESAARMLERLAHGEFDTRPSVASYEMSMFHRTAARAFIGAGRIDEARAAIERITELTPSHKELDELRAALAAAEAKAREDGAGR